VEEFIFEPCIHQNDSLLRFCPLYIAGIVVRTDTSSFFMHHKFVIIDGTLLVNGSFNWTKQAITGNQENLLLTNNQGIVQPYLIEFNRLWAMFDPRKSYLD